MEATNIWAKCFMYEFWRFVFVQQEVAKLAMTAVDYPPMQKGASFNLEAVKAKIEAAIAETTRRLVDNFTRRAARKGRPMPLRASSIHGRKAMRANSHDILGMDGFALALRACPLFAQQNVQFLPEVDAYLKLNPCFECMSRPRTIRTAVIRFRQG